MSYKTILVYLDDGKGTTARVEQAIELAKATGAHLVGLALAAEPAMPVYVTNGLPVEVLVAQRDQAKTRAEESAEAFRSAVEKAGIPSDLRLEDCHEFDIPDTISLHGRYADLIVLGQIDPEEFPVGGPRVVENVVLSSGRPALVVPYIGGQKTLGERVAVAWNASREAARAVSDAMPILKTAKSVTVLAVNPEGGRRGHGDLPGADVGQYLARHGVKVETSTLVARDLDAGDTLLSAAADGSYDLLVMGAYGHSRLRELVLGGVTHHMLRHMTIPCLMAH